MLETNEIQAEWVSTFKGLPDSILKNAAGDGFAPFIEIEWFSALEETGCIGNGSGWEIRNLKVSKNSQIIAFCPLFVKTQSEGEFVWDYPWADVGRYLGFSYFPKMVGMSPFTPVPAYQFIVMNQNDDINLIKRCLEEIKGHLVQERLSGVHFQFIDEKMKGVLANCGFTEWKHHRYVLENDGLSSFDEFVERFNKNQARNIRREICSMEKQKLEIRCLTGNELTEEMACRMYAFYEKTNERFGPWGCKYLNREFFCRIFQTFREKLLVCAAYGKASREKPVGMSLLVRKNRWLYGRYWGSQEFIPNLHFNLCFYKPIEWAIDNGVRYIDPGLGSEHKARRGFRSTYSSSFHYFLNERMQDVFKQGIMTVNRDTENEIRYLDDLVPLKIMKK